MPVLLLTIRNERSHTPCTLSYFEPRNCANIAADARRGGQGKRDKKMKAANLPMGEGGLTEGANWVRHRPRSVTPATFMVYAVPQLTVLRTRARSTRCSAATCASR